MFRDLLDRTYLSRLRKSTPAAAQVPSAALPSMRGGVNPKPASPVAPLRYARIVPATPRWPFCHQDVLLIEAAEWPGSSAKRLGSQQATPADRSHVWTAPLDQGISWGSANISGAVMSSACLRGDTRRP